MENNDFLELLEKFGTDLTVDDLGRYFNAKNVLFTSGYIFGIGAIVTLGGLFMNIDIIRTSDPQVAILWLAAFLIALLLFTIAGIKITSTNPFKKQQTLFENYIHARLELEKLKNGECKT